MDHFCIIIAILVAIVIIALYQGLTTRYYFVGSKKTVPGKKIRLALVSDVHCRNFGHRQKNLLKVLSEKKPDIIFLAGDIIDAGASLTGLTQLLESISKLAPVFYVSGNHEYRSEKNTTIVELAAGYGINVLSDEHQTITVQDNSIIVAGINDPAKTKFDDPNYNQTIAMEQAFIDIIGAKAYKILVCHRPERIRQYDRYSFDLILSGHTHGGQARLPYLINGIWAPDQGFFPKYCGGLYQHGKTTHVVSRGVCFRWHLPRFFNPPELVIVDIGDDTADF